MIGAALSRRAMRVAALTALGALWLAGCGSAGDAARTSSGASAHTFVDLVSELPTNLDETGTPDPASTAIVPSWSSELVRPAAAVPGSDARLPADDAVVPYLATSWQRSADGSYTFELRRGVRGATGDPFTSADVKWSIDRALARSPVAPFLFALAHIDKADPVTTINSHRVRINVTGPSPLTLSVLASYDAGIYDSALYRAHATAADPWAQSWGSTHSASFGAYSVATFVPRRELVLVANPGFWRRPYYTQVIIREIVNSSARLSEVLAGTATHTSGLAWGDFQGALGSGEADGVRASVLQTGPGVVAWHLNVASGPLANPEVRQALSLGIDRSYLASAVDGGYDHASVLTIPAAFGQSQPTNTYDPEQARSLLRAAGYPRGFTIDVYTNDQELGGDSGTLLSTLAADLYAQLAVTLNVIYVNDSDQLLALEQQGRLESTIDADSPLLGGPAFLLQEDANAAIDPVSDAAEQHYASAALQTQVNQLLDSPGGAPTQMLVQQVAASIDTELPTINLFAIPIQNVTRANVSGYGAYTQPVTYYEYLHPSG